MIIQTYKIVVTTLVFLTLMLLGAATRREEKGANTNIMLAFAVLYVACVIGMWL